MACVTCQQVCSPVREVAPVPSVHDEHVAALWPPCRQLLGGDDCNGDSFGEGQNQKNQLRVHVLLKLTPLRSGGLSSCGPLSVMTH